MNNKNLQVKDQEKRSANVSRSSSYRLALRRSAPPPPESEDLLNKPEDKPKIPEKPAVVIQQPKNGSKKDFNEINDSKKDLDDTNVILAEPVIIIDHKTNGSKQTEQLNETKTADTDWIDFCCQKVCCNYCNCCPNCCLMRIRRLKSLLNSLTECGLNCLRVFT